MATGTLIAESLRAPSVLEGVPLVVGRIERVVPANPSADQRAAGIPATWTLLHVEVADADADRLAAGLAAVLDGFGWYADLQTAAESFVVFADRVFRYRRGDPDGRAAAEAHARAHGVPDAQIDWP
jgi:hypothetical protein